jgi:hypothetical protein
MERFLTHDRLISLYRKRYDVPKFPEDKLQMAYLDEKYEQFWLHLVKKNLDLNMVKKVIKECYNQLQNGDEVYKFAMENSALFDTIFYYMQHFKTEPEDEYKQYYDDTRVLASMCFKQFCRVADVKEKLKVCKYIEEIHLSFEDEVEDVRINVYLGLLFYSQSRYGIDALLENHILEQIIKKLTEEKSLIVINLIMMLINEILNAYTAPQIALKEEVLLNLKLYINCEDLNVLENTILNYGSLAICEEGKKKCVEEGTIISNFIGKLKKFNSDDNDDINKVSKILIGCTRFLMNVSILKRGKEEIFLNGGIEVMFELLNGIAKDDIQLTLNVIQCVGNVAEEPRARELLRTKNYLDIIRKYNEHEDGLIKEQSKLTEEIILWEP